MLYAPRNTKLGGQKEIGYVLLLLLLVLLLLGLLIFVQFYGFFREQRRGSDALFTYVDISRWWCRVEPHLGLEKAAVSSTEISFLLLCT